MTIPPVEVRRLRPCKGCLFLQTFDDTSSECRADRGYSKPDFKYYHRWDSDDETIDDWHCYMNITSEETQELIDSGAV